MGDEYPIIEPGVVIEWNPDEWPNDLVLIKGMYADEDGNVQLTIDETAEDAPDGKRSIALEDLHDQLDWRDYSASRFDE